MFLLEWATRTLSKQNTVDCQQNDKVKSVRMLQDYANECLKFFPAKGSDDLKPFIASRAIKQMLEGLQRACNAAILTGLISGDFKTKDLSQVLPPDLKPVANVLQTNWDQACEDIQSSEGDLTGFLLKLEVLEAAYSATCGKFAVLGQDASLLEATCNRCQEFQSAFSKGIGEAASATSQVALPPLDRFISKYEAIQAAVEKWDLQDVEWIFKDESEAEVRQDIEDFKTHRQEFLDMQETLAKLVGHMGVTQSEELKAGLKACQDFVQEGQSKCEAGTKYVSFILLASCIVQKQGQQSLKKVDAYFKKCFGDGIDYKSLPAKLGENLKALEAEDSDKKEKAEKADKPKKEKKDKKAKDPEESKKRPSTEAKEPKAKKSRK